MPPATFRRGCTTTRSRCAGPSGSQGPARETNQAVGGDCPPRTRVEGLPHQPRANYPRWYRNVPVQGTERHARATLTGAAGPKHGTSIQHPDRMNKLGRDKSGVDERALPTRLLPLWIRGAGTAASPLVAGGHPVATVWEQDLRQRTGGKHRPLLPPDRGQGQGPIVVRPCRIFAVLCQPAGFHRQAPFGGGNSLYWALDDTSGRTTPRATCQPGFRPAGADHGPVPTLTTPPG